jgi:hypothetical protein
MAENLFKRISYEVAVLLSVATHPVLVFFGACCFLAASGQLFPPFSTGSQAYTLALILLSTVLIPVTAQYVLSKSLFMEEREERLWPLLVTASIYFFAWLMFRGLALPAYLMAFLLSLVIGQAGLYAITRYYKLSVHTSAAGSLVALFFSCICINRTLGSIR